MTDAALEVRDLTVTFGVPGSRGRLTAVDGVSLQLRPGEAHGLVGESGCGKSTLARSIVGLTSPDAGTVTLAGRELGRRRDRAELRRMQMVFQDPMSSLNPRMRVRDVLTELLQVHRMVPRGEFDARCRELVTSVGLPADVLDAWPGALSGGQRQRVSIARALALEPEILVADEVTSALDVSVQAQVLQLLLDLQRRLGLTLLFISHNLAVVRQICDRVTVMYLGRVVESGPTETLYTDPQHPYTRLLLGSVPRLGTADLPDASDAEPPDPANLPAGCRFHPRCPLAAAICAESDPALRSGATDHEAACHFAFPDQKGQ
ncbi:MAG TPA: ABC transporter ATP-binding protein [Mycobacteriales bacterium]|jgi:oligopeptide/dipeptide ABC transporter ATP-binding protein|nr:ABC transporter ATP-binding protein [Mycobacteriales bacterium]